MRNHGFVSAGTSSYRIASTIFVLDMLIGFSVHRGNREPAHCGTFEFPWIGPVKSALSTIHWHMWVVLNG
jgi:hypothetical protein